MEEAMQRLTTPGALPWESGDPRVAATDKLGSMKHAVMACLSRDPTKRPGARHLLADINGIWANTKPGSAPTEPIAVRTCLERANAWPRGACTHMATWCMHLAAGFVAVCGIFACKHPMRTCLPLVISVRCFI